MIFWQPNEDNLRTGSISQGRNWNNLTFPVTCTNVFSIFINISTLRSIRDGFCRSNLRLKNKVTVSLSQSSTEVKAWLQHSMQMRWMGLEILIKPQGFSQSCEGACEHLKGPILTLRSTPAKGSTCSMKYPVFLKPKIFYIRQKVIPRARGSNLKSVCSHSISELFEIAVVINVVKHLFTFTLNLSPVSSHHDVLVLSSPIRSHFRMVKPLQV